MRGSSPPSAATPRLVFVNRFYFPDISATSQHLTDLAEHLAAAGVEVHVVCSSRLYDAPGKRLPASEIVRGVRIHRLQGARLGRQRLLTRAFDDLFFHLAVMLKLHGLLRAGDVVVAKTDPPMLSVSVAVAAATRRANLVNWLQDVFPEVAMRLGALRLPGWCVRAMLAVRNRSLRAARCNVAIDPSMKRHLATLGLDPGQVAVIENWADPSLAGFDPGRRSALRLRLGLERQFVVQYSGNLGRAHDGATLLEAASILRDAPEIVFLMVGGGAGMLRLRAEAERLGLANLRFLPYQPRELLADALAAGDVHVASLRSELEGLIFPSKVYGILAVGRPALFIGDPQGGVAELFSELGCGIAIRAGDGARLAQEILALRAEPQRCADMGRRARSGFLLRFTRERACREWRLLLGGLGFALSDPEPVRSAPAQERARRIREAFSGA
jgi:glycosyltransferase involved in cell wall biosynthesis